MWSEAPVVRVEQRAGVARVVVEGDLDLVTAPLLARTIGAQPLKRGATVEIDLGNVAFIDSAGLSVLLRTRRQLQAIGARLRFREVPVVVRRRMELAGVDRVLLGDALSEE